jgi:hypothetical protein
MASPGKRSHDSPLDEQSDLQARTHRSSGKMYTFESIPELPGAETDVIDTRHTTPSSDTTDASRTRRCPEGPIDKLESKQKRFLQRWYEDFAEINVDSSLSSEYAAALAKAIRADPQLVFEFIDKRHRNAHNTQQASTVEDNARRSSNSTQPLYDGSEADLLTEANSHLPPTTLTLVEKYVIACRRRRSQNDGRRSVNTGPYRCTFGCGYRTKRAFDWRRHEETHEPQELWLCTICTMQNPFLVNRKDKFLKHVNDKHRDHTAEKALDDSKVAFVPSAELACPYCGAESGSWDERCRHVLGHFEDEVERGIKRVRLVREEDDEPEGADPQA